MSTMASSRAGAAAPRRLQDWLRELGRGLARRQAARRLAAQLRRSPRLARDMGLAPEEAPAGRWDALRGPAAAAIAAAAFGR